MMHRMTCISMGWTVFGLLVFGAGCQPKPTAAPPAPQERLVRSLYYERGLILDLDRQVLTGPPPGGWPTGEPYIALHNLGEQAARFPVRWAVWDFTGFQPPEPITNYQRANDSIRYGRTAVQAFDDVVGVHLESASTSGLSELRCAAYSQDWTELDDIRPWSRPDAELVFAHERKVPTSTTQYRSASYTQEYLLLKDTTSGQSVWLGLSSFDSRGRFPEVVMVDNWAQGTGLPIAMSSYGAGTRFCRMGANSARSSGELWRNWRPFEFRISARELRTAVRTIRVRFPQFNLSDDPAAYQLTHFNCLAELYTPQDGRSEATLGTAIRKVKIYSEYRTTEPAPR